MTTPPPIDATIVERVIVHGDLQLLTAAQKASYYGAVCASVGLNPLTQPFQYLVLNGREILYARREATEQLRQIHQVSVTIVARELVDDIYVVTARATLPGGRTDENIGAVPLAGTKGETRANNMMKAETKAKRRVTLAICGLGLLDETEVATLPPEAVGPAPAPALDLPPVDHDLPEGVVRILKVTSEPTRKPGVTRHRIVFNSGEEVTTINDWKAAQAQRYVEHQTLVRAEVKDTRWGKELVGLQPLPATGAAPETPPEAPPLTAADIPF